jgi:hypothetical protein
MLLAVLAIIIAGRWETARYGTYRRLGLSSLRPEPSGNKPLRTSVLTRLEQFNPSRGVIDGHVRITIELDQNANEKFAAPTSFELKLIHAVPEQQRIIEQGHSQGILPMRSETSFQFPISGEGQFSWNVVTDRSPFWYPFDRYRLFVNPELVVPETARGQFAYFEHADLFELDVAASNLIISATTPANPGGAVSPDPYEVKLKRPIIISIMALALVIIGVGFLSHLATVDDVSSLMWQSLTFFAGIWGVRSILLTGFAVFPVLIDYVTLTLYLLASIILLYKRYLPKRHEVPRNSGQDERGI